MLGTSPLCTIVKQTMKKMILAKNMTSKASTYGQLCGCVCLCTECTLTRCFILYTAQIHKELNVSIFRYVLRIFVSWANVFIAKRNCFMNSITVSCVYGCCSMNRGRIFFSFFSIFRFAIFITHTKHIAQSDNNNDDHFQDRERERERQRQRRIPEEMTTKKKKMRKYES